MHRRREPGRVLLVANYESDVGYAWWLMENFWQLIARSMAERGRECLLVYPRIGQIPDSIRTAPLRIAEFNFTYNSWSNVLKGVRFIRQQKIDSIYLTDWPYLHWAYLIWRLAGVRSIVLHDHTPGDRPALLGLQGRIKSALHRLRVLSATLYVAVSTYISRRLQRNARVPANRCVIVSNGIMPIDSATVDRADIRERLNIPADAVLIVMVSRATYYKGLDFALRCFEAMLKEPRRKTELFAVHCGDGPDLKRFVEIADAAGISDRFRFLGRRSDVREILAAADIAFHPSNGEAMSLAILEFMSAGLAVVSSDLPSVCTAIAPGLSGLTYRHGHVDDAVRVLESVVDAPEFRRRLGSCAAATCRTQHTLDAMNREFVEQVIPEL